MDGLGARAARGVDETRRMQVALAGGGRSDALRPVRGSHVQGVFIRLGVDGDRLDAQGAAGADDAECDLAAIGDQDPVEHHILNTPNDASGIGALAAAASASASAPLVCSGSSMPSSHRRAVA